MDVREFIEIFLKTFKRVLEIRTVDVRRFVKDVKAKNIKNFIYRFV